MKANTIKPIKRKCSVEGCENEVADGNRFLCRIHYIHGESIETSYNLPYDNRKISRPASQ